jgi:hypothetical protein
MLERVRDELGESLPTAQAFLDSSNQYWGRINRFDKLERLQYFREPGHKSWEAFDVGDWQQSQNLTERDRSVIAKEFGCGSRVVTRDHATSASLSRVR